MDMRDILKNDSLKPLKVGEIVEGKIIGSGRSFVALDLGPKGTGIIYGREFYNVRDELKNLEKGEKVFAKVIDLENKDGFVELSLSGASREMSFLELKRKKEEDELLEVKILGANRGGLITEVSGIPAFIPVSQLSSEHYPRVEGGDKSKILSELQKFVGQTMKAKILNISLRSGQVILSERKIEMDEKRKFLEKYKPGDIVNGEITGVTSFGAFIRFGEGLEGLIHISEMGEGSDVIKVGDKVKAKIVNIINGRVYLSLRESQKES